MVTIKGKNYKRITKDIYLSCSRADAGHNPCSASTMI